MKPLALLITAFILSLALSKIMTGDLYWSFCGNLAMCLMLCFTALGHFKFGKGMKMMIPPVVPFKTLFVYLSGVAEIIIGIALLFPAARVYAGYVLIVFFLLILPANVYGAFHNVNLEKAAYNGPGPRYLWFRIPMQLFLIGWVFYFAVMEIR